MKTFLKTKVVPLDSENVEITQLSGLHRFDFLDYCSGLQKPTQPTKPAESASEQEVEQYYEEMDKCLKQWARVNFIGQSRLVAYGYLEAGENLEDRHQLVMSAMTPEQVKYLHDEIAKFSGIPLPEKVETNTEDDSEQEVVEEPIDPKG